MLQMNNVPFRIQSIRSACAAPQKDHELRIIHIANGAGAYYEQNKLVETGGDSLFFLHNPTPGRVEISEESQGQVYSFTHEFIQHIPLVHELSMFGAEHMSSAILVDSPVKQEVELILQKIRAEYESERHYRLDIIRDYLKIIVRHISRSVHHQQQSWSASRKTGLVRQFLQLLDQQYTALKKVTHYAEKLHVTSNHLNTTLKDITGITASEHIRRRVISEAKLLALRRENYSMKEIAYHLGFEDKSHFSKYFKNASGKNFTNYKKELALEA
ncbi:helix-turn-helix domain-containing protein [Chitinophaga sp. YIM B06452]|uniref:helix-turn-helix domain-containing protein n=1 Tax=Chitinophaga sp. YIM B06452 TaxID=3082158 RepID=UPI0031FEAFB7